MITQSNPVGWFEIYVQDINRATKFYEAVFDTTLQSLPMPDGQDEAMEMMAFPMLPEGKGASGALVKMTGMSPGGSGTIVYFSSEDCAIEQVCIEAAGGKVIQKKTNIGEYGFMVMATDTEGNTFGIHSNA